MTEAYVDIFFEYILILMITGVAGLLFTHWSFRTWRLHTTTPMWWLIPIEALRNWGNFLREGYWYWQQNLMIYEPGYIQTEAFSMPKFLIAAGVCISLIIWWRARLGDYGKSIGTAEGGGN